MDPERRRAQLLDAAEAVFEDRDPLEVTFEQVADAAGVSRALVYNYFGDRLGLVAAMYQRWTRDLDREVVAALTSTDPPEQRLRRLIRSHVAFASRHRGVVRFVRTEEASGRFAVDQTARRRHDRIAEAWGSTPADRLIAHGVLALLERVSIDGVGDGGLDAAATEELVFELLWSGLASSAASPFRSRVAAP